MRRPSSVVLLLAGGALLAGLGIVGVPRHRVVIGEIAAFLAMALLVSRHPTVRATFRSLDPGPRVVLVLLPALLVAGHVADVRDRLYPFVTWELYATSLPRSLAYHDYTAALASGREVSLPVRDLFPTLGGRVSVFLDGAVRRALHAEAGPSERAATTLNAILRALAREHERRHGGGPIHSVDVWHRTIPIDSYRGRASIARHHDGRVDVR